VRDKLTANVHGRKMVYVYRPGATLQELPYERMTMAEARRRGIDDLVVMCAACSAPAEYVDYLFPYHQEWNRCARCVDVPLGERREMEGV
jgi:hypothetical protein